MQKMPIKKLFTKIKTINQMGHLPRKLIIDPKKVHTFTYFGKEFVYKFPTLRDEVSKLKIEIQKEKDKLIFKQDNKNNKNLNEIRASITKTNKIIRKLEIGMNLIKQKELIMLDSKEPNYNILTKKYNSFNIKLDEKLNNLYDINNPIERNKREILYSQIMKIITRNLELRKTNSRIKMFSTLDRELSSNQLFLEFS
ncbi:MAG: hypothetical protein WCF78_03510 [archaeon]